MDMSNDNHVQVFQAVAPSFFRKDGDAVSFPAGYELVASVKVPEDAKDDEDALHCAYEFTNTIHRAWFDGSNPAVTNRFTKAGCRSTSVGDVMLVNGNRYVVAMVGFEKF